jgi:hypothetical protein
MYGNAKEGMDDILSIQRVFLSFFKRSILGGIFQFNQHLLILVGHGSHVIVQTIKHWEKFGLDMITLPFHTSHAL